MNDEQADKFEQRVRFIAKHYREGAFDTGKAWEKFAAGKNFRKQPWEEKSRMEKEFSGPQPARKGASGRSLSEENLPDGSFSEKAPAAEGLSDGRLATEAFSDARIGGEALSDGRVSTEALSHGAFSAEVFPGGLADRVVSSKRPSSFRRFLRYGAAAAAVVGLLVGIVVFYRMQESQPDWVAVATAARQTKEVYLPDSTVVTLAGGSEIRYDRKSYGKETRVVEMKGKLFFQVKREVARPFSVLTRYTRVTVLGTTFQVEAEDTLTQVHVASGKVSFAAGGEGEAEEVILTAGMTARYETAHRSLTLAAAEDPNFLSWKTGELCFKDTPLEQVINDLNAYYRVNIRNRTESAGVKLTATFRQRPLEEVLTVINQTLDTRLTVDPVE